MEINLTEGKFRLKASFEKEKAKVHTIRRGRICTFQIGKIILGK